MKNNSQIKYVNNAKLLNKREMKILDDAGLKKVYDFQDLPVIGLIQLNKLGFESAVDVLKLLHPYYKQKLKLGEEIVWNRCDEMTYIDLLLSLAGYNDAVDIASLTVGQALSVPGITCDDVRLLTGHILKTYDRLYKYQDITMITYEDVMRCIPVLYGTLRQPTS